MSIPLLKTELKSSGKIILLFLGIIFSAWIEMAFTLQAVIQGILVAGTAVMGNQIPKQLMKDE